MVNTDHYADDINDEGEYIPKAYQFERDMDHPQKNKRFDTLVFEEEANERFVYEDMETLLETEEGKDDLANMIRSFRSSQYERLKTLEQYSKGENVTILAGRRRIEENKSDNRIRHNFGGYISGYITGFLMSEPIDVTYEDDKKDVSVIDEINTYNDSEALDYDIGYDASRYGRAYELHYRDKNNEDRIVLIDPKEVFLIHEISVEKEIIGAVHCPVYNGKLHITVYTDEDIISFKPSKAEQFTLELADEAFKDGVQVKPRKQHDYGMVPVVEWNNNRFREGDWENEIPIIDGYDASQSDTANYMSDLNDALLFLSGDLSAMDKDGIPAMMDANVILAESGTTADGKQTSVDGKYLYKQYDVQGTESYKDRLLADLFKLAGIPNMDDQNFGGNQSGVAIQYKLLGLKQIQKTKETQFNKALRRRYRLIQNIHEALNDDPIEADKLTFTFHPNLPSDVWAEVDKFINAGGQLSQETLAELATFTNFEQEAKRIEQEEQNRMAPFMDDRDLGDTDAGT